MPAEGQHCDAAVACLLFMDGVNAMHSVEGMPAESQHVGIVPDAQSIHDGVQIPSLSQESLGRTKQQTLHTQSQQRTTAHVSHLRALFLLHQDHDVEHQHIKLDHQILTQGSTQLGGTQPESEAPVAMETTTVHSRSRAITATMPEKQLTPFRPSRRTIFEPRETCATESPEAVSSGTGQ